MTIVHDSRCVEYSQPGHPERPARIAGSVAHLQKKYPTWLWREPQPATREQILRAHSPEHIQRIADAVRDFDADTPAYPNIYDHAARAAGAAIEVACEAMRGKRAFSLMRPPGHHATRNRAMGFCFFNHIAIAALNALENVAERVAIWDFDAHHGNGTEEIVAGNSRIDFASIHQFPGYPGTGTRSFQNIRNYPVAPMTPRAEHMREIKIALDGLTSRQPSLLLVSAGFDAYVGDPITQMTLLAEDFAMMGQWLAELRIPVGAILEGGYSDDLPTLIDKFLSGWEPK